MINTTIVTGIWDLNRSSLSEGWSRSFDHYIQNFSRLLESLGEDVPLIVFIDEANEDIVWKYRSKENTKVYHHPTSNFGNNFFPFKEQVDKIRNNPEWYNQTGWLKDSTQCRLEMYNPMVMSKMFLLHNAKVYNPFSTEYMFWLDGGITNTIHPGYFSHDKVIHKLENITKKFLFVCFPYETNSEIHGFKIDEMNKIAGEKVNRVARGGIFGGHIEYISQANDMYYGLLRDSLSRGFMGTEESIFTLMTYLDPDTYHYETIEGNGLLGSFFEKLKNNTVKIQENKEYQRIQPSNNKVLLYINAFNSPEQLLMVLESFEQHDKNFIDKTQKVLLNNSTKESLFPAYDKICSDYGFVEQIRRGNLGICRSRQLAAEHFADSGSRYMLFFEDDMLLDLSDKKCKFGFNKKVDNLFDTMIKIMNNEEYDFLKLSFSEFYGHNGEQWSWHNVPSQNRIKYFPKTKKRPNTIFNNIKTCNGTPYADGEVYYSNWPQIVDQEGNKKLFLDTKWDNPFEQTWMSHIYTLTIEKKVRPGILLASPITHNRTHFYPAEDRREN